MELGDGGKLEDLENLHAGLATIIEEFRQAGDFTYEADIPPF